MKVKRKKAEPAPNKTGPATDKFITAPEPPRTVLGWAVAEPIFRKYIKKYIAEMSDERLENLAANTLWLCERTLPVPFHKDAFERDLIRAECERREKPEIFQRAEERIFKLTRRSQNTTFHPLANRSDFV
jgi:hypothetical protein